MKKSLKFQFISLFTSRNFNIILMLSIVFALAPTLFYGIKFHSADINTIPAAYSFFLGSGYIGIFNKIYYVLMPLIVVIPFADSYYTDCKNHTIYGILSKCTLKQYYYSKLICVFSSGVIVILIPLLINFLLNLAVFPVNSTVEYLNGFGQIQNQLYTVYPKEFLPIFFYHLFCTNQYLYELVYLLIASLFGGLLAAIIFQISFFYKGNKILLNCLLFIINNLLSIISATLPINLNLQSYIYAGYTAGGQSYLGFAIILIICLACVLITIPINLKRLKNIL